MQRITDTVASFLGKRQGLEGETPTPNSESNTLPTEIEQKIDWEKLTAPGRIYTLKSTDEPTNLVEAKSNAPFRFYVLGCADNGVKAQKTVAELMNKTAEADKKPDLIIFLGDNFTSHGISTCHHDVFNSNFHDIYQAPELKSINNIPCLVILGNHDCDAPNIDAVKINAQIQHTFFDKVDGDKIKFDITKIKIFTPDKEEAKEVELDLPQLKQHKNKWNMPSRYYGLRYEKNKEFFFIDSNTYVKEYIEYYLKESSNKNLNKQPAWLESVAKNPGTIKLLFLHHSLHSVGKRTLCSDATDYLNAEDFVALQKIGINGNYNEILRLVLQRQGLEFDTVFAAHDHSMYYHLDKDKKLCQVVAGGAGGPLQNRFNYEGRERTPCFIKDNGFVKVEIPTGENPEMIFDFHTISGHHLQFSHKKTTPIKNPRDEKLALLSESVITACDEYQDHLSKNPQLPWTFANKVYDVVYDDVIYVDELKNYFNRVEPTDFEASIKFLKAGLSKCAYAKSFPKWHEVFNKLLKNYNTSYDRFIGSTEHNLERPSTPPVTAESNLDKARVLESKDAEPMVLKSAETWTGVRFFGLLGGSYATKVENKSPAKAKDAAPPTSEEEGIIPSKPILIPKKPQETKDSKGNKATSLTVSESPPVVTKFNSPNTSFSVVVSTMAESYFAEKRSQSSTVEKNDEVKPVAPSRAATC